MLTSEASDASGAHSSSEPAASTSSGSSAEYSSSSDTSLVFFMLRGMFAVVVASQKANRVCTSVRRDANDRVARSQGATNMAGKCSVFSLLKLATGTHSSRYSRLLTKIFCCCTRGFISASCFRQV